jgi:O-antigen/teichoic acid export membrane protein
MTRPDIEPPQESITFLGDFSKKLVTNTFFNLIGRSWSFLITLLLTPYILSHLDVTDFGIWVILSVLISSFTLLDLGLGSSFVKFISAYYTHEDYESINKVLFTGLIFYVLFGAVLIAAGRGLEGPLFRLFNIRDASEPYLLVLVACAITNVGAMFLSVFRGIQRMDRSNSIEVRMSLVNVAGTVFFLQLGYGLFGLALNALVNAIIALGMTWWEVRRAIPKIALKVHFDRRLLREMFSYGAKIQVSRLGSVVCFQMDKLIISRFLGIGTVSFYEVSSRLASFMRAVPLVMLSAIIPATSELGARNEAGLIVKTYLLASRYVAMVTIALVAFLFIEAGSLLQFWLGEGFEQSVILVQILAIGYGVNVLGGAASQTGAGVGRPEFDMRSTILLAIINPILSLLLIRQFGAAGAAAGTCVALISAAVYLLFTFHRNYIDVPIWSLFNDIHLRPFIAGVLSAAAVAGFHYALPGLPNLLAARYLIPIKIALDFAIFGPVYVVLLVALRQVTAIDWKNFLGLMTFGFEFLRHPFRERVKIYR